MKSKIVRALTNACIQYKTTALYRKFVHMGFECLCATDFYFLISTCKPNSGWNSTNSLLDNVSKYIHIYVHIEYIYC